MNRQNPQYMHAATWHGRLASVFAVMVAFCAACDRAHAKPTNEVIELLDEVGIDPQFDAQIPLALKLVNSKGEEVPLGDCLSDKPVILHLMYFKCPRLCHETADGLIRTLRTLSMDLGDEFEVITVSFDPREGPVLAAEAKQTALDRYGRGGGESWHFLTGDEQSVRKLADTVGFHYAFDEARNQYAHGAGVFVLTPDGRVSRYFGGVEFSARDLRLGLVEASKGEITSIKDSVLLLCFQYDPASGKYGFAVITAIRIAGMLTIAVLIGGIVYMLRRERKKQPLEVVESV